MIEPMQTQIDTQDTQNGYKEQIQLISKWDETRSIRIVPLVLGLRLIRQVVKTSVTKHSPFRTNHKISTVALQSTLFPHFLFFCYPLILPGQWGKTFHWVLWMVLPAAVFEPEKNSALVPNTIGLQCVQRPAVLQWYKLLEKMSKFSQKRAGHWLIFSLKKCTVCTVQ